jgi:diguanylate cyclase (GGDEF)-like protein
MLIKLLNKYGFWPTLSLLTLLAMLLSTLLTRPVASLFGIEANLASLMIGAVIALILGPTFGYIQLRLVVELENTRRKLLKLATTDSLTGVNNRRHFFELAEQVIAQNNSEAPITLALIDADNFKEINDTHGHLVGDEILLKMVTGSLSQVRPGDVFARFGGDEFILLCPETGEEEILPVVRQLIYQIQQIKVGPDTDPLYLSVTIGVATNQGRPHSLKELIIHADHALLEAKKLGGNRFHIAGPSP